MWDALRGRGRLTSTTELGPLKGTAMGAMIAAVLSRPAVVPPARPATVAPPPGAAGTDDAAVESALRDGIWFFQAFDGTVLAMIAVTLAADSGLDESTVRGSMFVLEGAAVAAIDGAQLDFTEMPKHANQRPVFVGRVQLEPGAAAVIRYAFTDASKRTMLVRSRSIRVPELGSGGFSVSSLVPAESFGPLADGVESVFAVGSETVVPRPGASFARGETLRLYLQVYGAQVDPERKAPRVDVEFVFRREDGKRSRRYGSPYRLRGAFGASLGLSIPIGDWPPGAYGVEVRLHDRVAGRAVTAEGKFTVTE